MAVRSNVVTVGTTPVVVAPAPDGDNRAGRDVAVQNVGSVTVFLGSSTVTTTTGFPLAAGAGMTLNDVTADSLPFAVAASGTGSLAVLEVGV